MIYINPRKDFDEEGKIAIKIQIDNSLDLGWKREDILLFANFPYQYRGVKAIMVSGDNYYSTDPPAATKTYTIPSLFKQNLIENGEIYWSHDLDVYQNEVITDAEMESELGMAEMGMTDKGRMPMWNMGSIFFKSAAKEIFDWNKDLLDKFETSEEHSIWALCGNDVFYLDSKAIFIHGLTERDNPKLKYIHQRIKTINISYNFRMWNIRSTISIAKKPIRAVHFHFPDKYELDFFMYGKNKLNMVLIPERLIKIFNKHGVS